MSLRLRARGVEQKKVMNTDLDLLIATLKEIATIIGVLATAGAVIWGGYTSWKKSKAETSNIDVDTQTKRRKEDIELVDKMTDVNQKVITSLEHRFDQLSKDFEEAKKELEHFKQMYAASERLRLRYREGGIRLLTMIRTGIKTRRTRHEPQCEICENYDLGTLRVLAEIEPLFAEEPSEGETDERS
jgi:hypothetical protein